MGLTKDLGSIPRAITVSGSNNNVGIGTGTPDSKLNVVTSGGKSTISIGDAAAGTYSQLLMYGGSGRFNWSLGAQYNVSDAFEITRSTVVDGTTFSTPYFVVNSAGNVGIGTTTPETKLHVASSENANWTTTVLNTASEGHSVYTGYNNSTTAIRYGVYITGGGNDIYSYDLQVGSGKLLVRGDGNVGIGTTSPSQRLDVRGFIVSDVGNNGVEGGFYLGNAGHGLRRPGSLSNDVYLYTTAGTLYLGANGASSQQVAILNNGNVGIGTTGPAYRLSIQGSAGIEQSEEYFYFNSSYVVGSNARARIRAVGAGGGSGYGGDFRVSTRATNNVWNEDAFVINSAGNVGIGTTSPSFPLHLYKASSDVVLALQKGDNYGYVVNDGTSIGLASNLGSTGYKFLVNRAAPDNAMIINSSGNVGIGTTTPTTKLDVQASGVAGWFTSATDAVPLSVINNGTTISTVGFKGSTTDNQYVVRCGADGNDFITYTNNTERMRIYSDGSIGFKGSSTELASANLVNTNSSFTIYATDGGGTTKDIILQSGGSVGAPKFTIKASGDVGIGVTSPSAKLDINGDVRYRGTIYNQFEYIASGNFSSGTYYNVVDSSQLTEGIYIITGYVDTYACGGGIYYMQFASVPFYFWGAGSNSGTFTDLPEPIGTGHHKGNPLPLFRLQHTPGADGKVYLQFTPNSTWTGVNNTGGKVFQVRLKRIG